MILPGMNGRFFPANHRPARQEIAFATGAGFLALQFQGWEAGLPKSGGYGRDTDAALKESLTRIRGSEM